MKKHIIKIALGGALVLGTAMGITLNSKQYNKIDDLFMQNVEALASGEGNLNPYYEAGYFYCRCKDDSNGVKKCYGGNAVSLRPNCFKGTSSIMCNEFNSNCKN